jgi:hypothetical protein
MPLSPRIHFPYPDQSSKPWDAVFEAMVDAIDASLYAEREDRNLLITAGGTISFEALTGVLTWGANIEIFAPTTGFFWVIAGPGSITLADGALLFVTVPRAPQNSTTVAMQLGSVTPNEPRGDDQVLIGLRRNTRVYFRDGLSIGDGESFPVFDSSAGGGAIGIHPVVFDGTVNPKNLRSDRLANQSPIDNTKKGIVNFGSDTVGGSLGATNDLATIGGGDQNAATGIAATVPGGALCTASGGWSTAAGSSCTASGASSTAFGASCTASGTGSVALGAGAVAGPGTAAFACGSNSSATGQWSFASGRNCIASGINSTAQGRAATASRVGQYAYNSGGTGQVGRLVLWGSSVNGATVPLQISDAGLNFTPASGFAYRLTINIIANGQNPTNARAMWSWTALLHGAGGNCVLDALSIGDTNTNGTAWAASVTASGADLLVQFTGTVGQTVIATCDLSWVEVGGGVP